VYIAAAKVQVTAHKRLGMKTPEVVERLARGEVDDRVREAIQRDTEERRRAASRKFRVPQLKYSLDVYVAAAELRVATDRKLGWETPETIVRLAHGEMDEWLQQALFENNTNEAEHRPESKSHPGASRTPMCPPRLIARRKRKKGPAGHTETD
jgi:hypothetical protein